MFEGLRLMPAHVKKRASPLLGHNSSRDDVLDMLKRHQNLDLDKYKKHVFDFENFSMNMFEHKKRTLSAQV